jgi:3-oxoacyl-[acyl-carrier-protein] synthase III
VSDTLLAATTAATQPAGAALPVGILGLGVYLPDRVVSNDDLTRELDTSDEWIRTRTGIHQRHVAAADQATADLAAGAARAALDDAGLQPADIGMLLVATTTPDHPVPGSAPLVAAALGVEVAALDVNAACSGFVYGLQVAAGLVLAGRGPVLLIGAETLTRIVDPADRTVRVLFGDGAGAVVLGLDDRAELGPFDLGSDGTDPSILWQEATGTRLPATSDMVAEGRHYLTMRGTEVYRNAVQRMAQSSRAVLDAAGLTVDDVDLFIGHQANRRILDAVADRLAMPAERCHITVDRHANTSAASIPLALGDARDAGRLHDGDRVLLTAFGAGLTWGSVLLTWRTS